jgi:solute carrier family 6 amino acid transporter-like protein 5/7/9/14
MFIVGRPMYFFELLLGQFSNSGCVQVWQMAPAFRGLGYAMTAASAITSTFYSSIMATIILYAIFSFWKPLPWAACLAEDLILDGKQRTDVHCEEILKDVNITLYQMLPDVAASADDRYCGINGDCFEIEMNTTAEIKGGNGSNAEMFFRFYVLKSYTDIENGIGVPDWKLTLCLLITWVVIFVVVVRGVTGAGKIAWFSAMFPYVILFALFGVSITLPHATDGVYYFFNPNWKKLVEIQVWFQAVQQCFFSLGMGFGPVIVFGSYNGFRHNISRDVWIVSFMDAFTSLLAGSTIFAILGNLADGRDISTVVESGPNIAFVSYPAVMKDFGPYPIPQIISFLFFFMLLVLGLGSGTSFVTCVITVILDHFPGLNKKIIATLVCITGFSFATIYVTPGGSHMVLLMDTFGSSLVLYVIVLTEVIVVAWIYGLRNFCNDIEFMLQGKLSWYWKICWGTLIPAGLLFTMVYSFMTFETPSVGDVPLPMKAIAIGGTVGAIVIAIIPGVAVYIIFTRKTRSCYKKLRAAFSPSRLWGPKEVDLHAEWEAYKKTQPYRYHPWKIFSRDWRRRKCKCGGWWKRCRSKCCHKKPDEHENHPGQESQKQQSQPKLPAEPDQQIAVEAEAEEPQ